MEELTAPINEQEIQGVIGAWSSDKAQGSDDFTGEFYKTSMEIILSDLMNVYNSVLQNPQMTLHPLNGSSIIMVPKKEDVVESRDYRPISVVHAVQRILSKILAQRL
jgi:hypothetical protein